MYIRSDLPGHTSQVEPAIDFSQTGSTTCGFEGNNNIYGNGIRIGIYAQILAVWFANYFLHSKARLLRDSVSVFGIAILIVTVNYAANAPDFYAVEAFVLLLILAWSWMMGVRYNSSYKGTFSNGSLLKLGIYYIVNLVNICLHVWFWWVGVGKMKTTPGNCGTKMLLYVIKTDMQRWARKVMMALSLFVLICTVWWVSVDIFRTWAFWKIRQAKVEFVEALKKWEKMEYRRRSTEDIQDCQVNDNDVSDGASSHDGCSKYSCDRCSPIKSNFETCCRPIQAQSIRKHSVEVSTRCKRHSRISVQEIEAETTHSTPHIAEEPNTDLAIIKNVYDSERYIHHCIASSPYQMSTDGKSLSLLITVRSILFPNKYRQNPEGMARPPSWFRCHLRIWRLFLTCSYPSQAFVIFSHLRQSHLDPLNGPFQVYAAATYQSTSGVPLQSWPVVSLASSLILKASSTPKKVRPAWYFAGLDLFIHIIVILQIELTLRWNNVSGLSGLWTSVGQLVPFIIGLGGLALVIQRWIGRLSAKITSTRGMNRSWEEEKGSEADTLKEAEPLESFGFDGGVAQIYEQWKCTI